MNRTFWCKRCNHRQPYAVNPKTLEVGATFYHQCAACQYVHVYRRSWDCMEKPSPQDLRSWGIEELLRGNGEGITLCADLFVNWYALPRPLSPPKPRPHRRAISPWAQRPLPAANDPGKLAAEAADAHTRLTLGRNVVLTDKARAMVARLEEGQQTLLKRQMSFEDVVSAFLVMDGSDELELAWAVNCRFQEAQAQRGTHQPILLEQLRYTHSK